MLSTSALTRFEFLRNYRGPGLFLGAGVVAGLLVFLIWFVSLPSSDKIFSAAQPSVSGKTAIDPLTGQAGVLDGITGSPNPNAQLSTIGQGETGEEFSDAATGEEPIDEFSAEDGSGGFEAGPAPSAEEALANGLLDEAPPTVAAAAGALQTYYIEVTSAPGVVEILEVNAESPEHARSIVRDFRGNPQIIRGPSTQPLD